MIPNLHILGSKYLRTILKRSSSIRTETVTVSMKNVENQTGFVYYKEGYASLAMYRENESGAVIGSSINQ